MINSAAGPSRKGGSLLGLASSSHPPCSSQSISKGSGVRRHPWVSCHPSASSK